LEHEIPQNITFITALAAGLLSFLSPCVLPLIPGYISFISGASIQQLSNSEELRKVRKKVIINSLFFVLGFSVVFISLGASATAIGKILLKYLQQISVAAGILIILAGIHMTGLLKITALYREKRFQVMQKPVSIWGSFIIGLAFAFGWTPCIGPILAGILAVAGAQETVFQGILLLALYSLGLAVPFMITAYSITLFFKLFEKIKKHLHIIELISGILLIIIGILIITGGLSKLASGLTFFNEFAK